MILFFFILKKNKGEKMTKKHDFNFKGGEYLTKIGATWFVSYSFYCLRDNTHMNWEKIKTHKSRISTFNKTENNHEFWLQQVVNMDNDRLNTNKLNLTAE
jgi:hypothetical protein